MTTSVFLAPTPILQFFNNLGQPNAGGSVLTQVGGLNYPTYEDSSGSTPLPNPIPLNSRGEVSNSSGISTQLFLESGVVYTFTLYDASHNQINQATWMGTNFVAASDYSNGYLNRVVNSIADLRSIKSSLYTRVFVTGYYSPGDGGGGHYWYDPTDTTSADNGGTVIVATDGGRWHLELFSQSISLKQFGALGDGITDDTAAIQSVLNYALTQTQANKNIEIIVPMGAYLHGPVSFDPAAFKGYGRVRVKGTFGASVLLSSVATQTGVFWKIGKYGGYGSGADWVFEDLSFKSNSQSNGVGVYLEALTWTPRFENCIFEGFYLSIQANSCINMEIKGCFFISSAAWAFIQGESSTGISGLDQPPANTRISHCYFGWRPEGTNKPGGAIVGTAAPGSSLGYNCIIDSCVFEEHTNTAIADLAALSAVTNCWFESATDTISGEMFNCVIANNFSSNPLFVSYGNTLTVANQNIIYNNGHNTSTGKQLYENFFNQIETDYVSASANVFCGSGKGGIISPTAGQGHFESSQAQLLLRNSAAAAGKWWRVGPQASDNNYVVYNQASTGVYLADGATAWSANSDERLKDIDGPIQSAIEKVSQIRGVIGRYKTDDPNVRRSFLIAQQVQKVLPEAVNQNEEGYLSVRYTDLIPLLVEAINEINKNLNKNPV